MEPDGQSRFQGIEHSTAQKSVILVNGQDRRPLKSETNFFNPWWEERAIKKLLLAEMLGSPPPQDKGTKFHS
jgi:hypothetical protein